VESSTCFKLVKLSYEQNNMHTCVIGMGQEEMKYIYIFYLMPMFRLYVWNVHINNAYIFLLHSYTFQISVTLKYCYQTFSSLSRDDPIPFLTNFTITFTKKILLPSTLYIHIKDIKKEIDPINSSTLFQLISFYIFPILLFS
jgi:hypothetical protein